jgi:hypothetical protein
MTTRIAPPLGAASGIAYVVALMAAGSNRSDSTAALAVELVAMLLFLPFLGYLWSVLRNAEGPGGWLAATVLATGVVAITIKMASAGPAVAARDDGISPALRDALQQVNDVSFIVTMLPLGVCMAAVAAVVLRTHVLPAWLGWMAAVTAPLLIANGVALSSQEGPAFLLFLLWTLVAGIVLLRRELSVPRYTAAARDPAVAS